MVTALTEAQDQSDLAAWVERFGLTHPVGGDFDWAVWDAYHQSDGRPQYAVIDRDFRLLYVGIDPRAAEESALDAL